MYFIQENAFGNIVCEMAAILSQPNDSVLMTFFIYATTDDRKNITDVTRTVRYVTLSVLKILKLLHIRLTQQPMLKAA